MFGYVRPLKKAMQTEDFALFQSAYCGLCHTMGRRYGFIARFLLQYDFTFLAILLSAQAEEPGLERKRCPASLLRKKCVCVQSDAFAAAADESVILVWWKCRDSILDNPFFLGLPARLFALLLYPAYRKAKRLRPRFDAQVSACMQELRVLEGQNAPSLDRTADTFARILQAAAGELTDPAQARIVGLLLYHVGRWIYLVDACDDREKDLKAGRYNPVIARYGLKTAALEAETEQQLRTTMTHSIHLAISAYSLMQLGCWSDIIGNILYYGLSAVEDQVMCGRFEGPADFKRKLRKRT